MRTCVVAGSQGTNTGAERKRFDGTKYDAVLKNDHQR